ncbi:hypothetical protein PEP31012_00875 [Pandoraea eparura]|uniref:DNA-binding protein n=1 Tax=Pandoraea eparura TaxID=2508291 RepID=A0A5E4SQI4_9BURK|nr:hypothetical protein [Pandoraea eparura]VVD76604.1 hypothetical protein PEP31012_00875 [Pandoraea eparura]
MEPNQPHWIDAVRANLQKHKREWPAIARDSGVPYHTVVKVASGRVTDPRVSTVQALHDYFARRTSEHPMPGDATSAN